MSFSDEHPRRSRLMGPWGCVLTLIGCVILLMVGCGFTTGYLPIRPFDADGWRQVQTTDNYVRLEMVESLVRSGQLEGLTRSQVLGLLGQPDGGPYFRDWDLVYWLGPDRGLFRVDSEWLVVRFGSEGTVSEYDVVSD